MVFESKNIDMRLKEAFEALGKQELMALVHVTKEGAKITRIELVE